MSGKSKKNGLDWREIRFRDRTGALDPPSPPVPASVCGEGDLEPHDASRLGEALAAAELQVDLALDLVVVSQSRHQLRQSERGDAQREVGSAHLVPRVRAVSAARAPGNLE